MSLADQIRSFVFDNFVEPAFRDGKAASVTAGSVHKAMALKDRIPAVVSAVGGPIFQKEFDVRLVAREGRPVSTLTTFTFEPSNARIPPLSSSHLEALKWFEEHANEQVPWSLLNNRQDKLAITPKGIYRPAGQSYALSVKIIPGGRYPDEEPVRRGGRYLFRYHQEEPEGFAATQYYTNLGLAACIRDDVPVGVIRQVKTKPGPIYEVHGLGRVIDWKDGFFTIELLNDTHLEDGKPEQSKAEPLLVPRPNPAKAGRVEIRPPASLYVRDITDRIRFSDQISGRGSREAPILTFARNHRASTSYTKTALAKLDWKSDYIIQYMPITAPGPRDEELVGRLVAIVSVYPKEGPTRDFLDPNKAPSWDVERWPDAIMLREVFWFVEPPELKPLLDAEAFSRMTSHARNRLGEPPAELYEAIKNLEIKPILDLYRSPSALRYLHEVVEPNPSMQVVANRRTGKAGYVYALSLPEYPGFLKIGSAFDPSLRARGLSTAIPNDFTIASAVFFDDCRNAERSIHSYLASCRHRLDREWFRCELNDFHNAALSVSKGAPSFGDKAAS